MRERAGWEVDWAGERERRRRRLGPRWAVREEEEEAGWVAERGWAGFWVGFPSLFFSISFLFFFSKLHLNLFEFKLNFEFKPYPLNQ